MRGCSLLRSGMVLRIANGPNRFIGDADARQLGFGDAGQPRVELVVDHCFCLFGAALVQSFTDT